MQGTTKRFDNVTIALHWLIGIGIIVVAIAELVRGEWPKGHFIREGLKALHNPVGTVIFALIMFRVAWRLAHPAPAMPDDMRGWEKVAAKLTHLALYGLMLAISRGRHRLRLCPWPSDRFRHVPDRLLAQRHDFAGSCQIAQVGSRMARTSRARRGLHPCRGSPLAPLHPQGRRAAAHAPGPRRCSLRRRSGSQRKRAVTAPESADRQPDKSQCGETRCRRTEVSRYCTNSG